MILVRDVFQVKFGQMKDALKVWNEGAAVISKASGGKWQYRLLTDLAGPNFYTLVFENTHESLTSYEQMLPATMGQKEFQDWYKKLLPLVVSGRREIYNVVE